MNTKDKKVTNLLINIGKCRDLLDEGNLDKIFAKKHLFRSVKADIVRQIVKYMDSPAHELDFNEYDLDELSTDMYNYIRNFQQKFLYSKFIKIALENSPIGQEEFEKISVQIGKEMKVDTILRECYKTIAYFGLVKYLWGLTDSRKDIGQLLTETVRSFLGQENEENSGN